MKRYAVIALTFIFAFLIAFPPAALAAPAPIGADDFVIKVGKTDFDMLTNDIDVAIWSSGKKLVYKKDDTREGFDYQVKAKEATFYIPNRDVMYACAARLTKKGVTARGIKIGSTLSALFAAYPETDDTWDDGKETSYYFQAPNAPESLPAAAASELDSVRPDYYYKLIITVSNKTNKVTSIYITSSWYRD